MVSLTDLEPEVVSLILELVDDTSPRSTRAVACVNRYLNEITNIISHRHKVIEIEGLPHFNAMGIIRSWIEDEIVLANIRSLTINGEMNVNKLTNEGDWTNVSDNDDVYDGDSLHTRKTDNFHRARKFMKTLTTLLSKIGKLRYFDWNIRCSMPVAVLDALECYQPASKLRVFNFTRLRHDEEEPEPIEERLAHCSALTHIRTEIRRNRVQSDRAVFLVEKAFRRIVASAPKLEYAGCITYGGEMLQDPGLADCKRINDAFSIPDNPNESVKNLTLDGVDIAKQTLDSWSTVVSLASLETVKFTRGLPTLDYFQCAATLLPNLKELSLNLLGVQGRPDRQLRPDHADRSPLVLAIQNYIVTCAPLQTLSLWSWMGIVQLQDILKQHGASLQNLHLHERESAVRDSSRILSVEDIVAIRDACPNLRSLTFDLHRHDSKLLWDNDSNKCYYAELAQIKQLHKIEIYFDLGAYDSIDANDPAPLQEYLGDLDDETNEDALPVSSTDPTTQITNLVNSPSQIPLTTSPSSSPPPAKRAKISLAIVHSDDDDLKIYVQNIWTAIFGKKSGARHLEVKLGNWDSRGIHGGQHLKRRFVVRPHERDDVFDPELAMFWKNPYGNPERRP